MISIYFLLFLFFLLLLLSHLLSFPSPSLLPCKVASIFQVLKSYHYKSYSCLLICHLDSHLFIRDTKHLLFLGSVITIENPKTNNPISVLKNCQSKCSDSYVHMHATNCKTTYNSTTGAGWGYGEF